MSLYMVQVPIQQHESMNICISSHMKGKIAFISALGNNWLKKSKIQILKNLKNFDIFKKISFFAVAV